MAIPQRIQRSRKKGYKLPDNTVCVTRPCKYSNPFKLRGDIIYGNASYRRKILDPWIVVDDNIPNDEYGHIRVIELYGEWLQTTPFELNKWFINPVSFTHEELMDDLSDKNLACWCALDKPCHADVLLRVVNEPQLP